MLVIRNDQLHAFSVASRESFLRDMGHHLRSHFGVALEGLDDADLKARISNELARAQGYGLATKRDLCRFLNLSATYGWGFDQAPESEWMKDCLTDTRVTDPSDRLNRLIDLCIHRERISIGNQALVDELLSIRPERARK